MEDEHEHGGTLTDEELALVPLFIHGLSTHNGKKNGVKSSVIVAQLSKLGHRLTTGRVRLIINHIRVHGLLPLVLAGNNGYWVSDDREEVEAYVRTLKSRERAIRDMRVAIQNQGESQWQHAIQFDGLQEK